MATLDATRLAQIISENVEAFKGLCEGLDDETASRAPSDRWSPKQIVSHLCGPDGTGHLPIIATILGKDTPRLDIEVEDPFFSERRAGMTFGELLSEFETEYSRMAELVRGLSEEQLNRKAHIPFLRDTPVGEYPTLATWIQTIGDRHLTMHTEHMREIMDILGVPSLQQSTYTAQESQPVYTDSPQ